MTIGDFSYLKIGYSLCIILQWTGEVYLSLLCEFKNQFESIVFDLIDLSKTFYTKESDSYTWKSNFNVGKFTLFIWNDGCSEVIRLFLSFSCKYCFWKYLWRGIKRSTSVVYTYNLFIRLTDSNIYPVSVFRVRFPHWGWVLTV